jgi:hypothetical protein
MTRPTDAQRRELAELEDHAATLSRTLAILRLGLANADERNTAQAIDSEIAYTIARLAEVQARRDALHRQLGG